MVEVKRDWDLLVQATECVRYMVPMELLRVWWSNSNHLMLVEGNNVGIATFEYPGLYTLHWYYQSARGRKAIDLGKAMVKELFENQGAEALRGLIREDMKASRWACKKVGMKSYGFLTYPDGEVDELVCLTKEEFLKELNNDG